MGRKKKKGKKKLKDLKLKPKAKNNQCTKR